MMYMVRKQLYIDKRQDRALKRRARALGVSEAALVRRAIDALLLLEGVSAAPLTDQQAALAELLDRAGEVAARGHRLVAPTHARPSVYEEREQRWVGR